MSRVAKQPITLPAGVSVAIADQSIEVKGPKGALQRVINRLVKFSEADGTVTFSAANNSSNAWAQAGTARALVNNMVRGVNQGFEKRLKLVGVGYRAQVQGRKVNLTLGFSHPVVHDLPEGVNAAMEGPTDLVLTSIDKQALGQTAAEIRAYRPPEPYKGKGVRYADERIVTKETKKK